MLQFDTNLNQSIAGFESEAVVTPENRALARQEMERLGNLLEQIQAKITLLHKREQVVETQLEAWSVIAIAGEESAPVPDQDLCTTMTAHVLGGGADSTERDTLNRRSIAVQETADAVVELLSELRVPLHYRDIYRELSARGMEVAGEDPAKTMLARYFNDERLQRISRGTYAINSAAGGEHVK